MRVKWVSQLKLGKRSCLGEKRENEFIRDWLINKRRMKNSSYMVESAVTLMKKKNCRDCNLQRTFL